MVLKKVVDLSNANLIKNIDGKRVPENKFKMSYSFFLLL